MVELRAEAGVSARALEFTILTAARTSEVIGATWGEMLLHMPEPDHAGAEAALSEALVSARQQGTRLWELRAATSLARLWRDQGKRLKARDLLAPVYGWFTEGFDTVDLKGARALLDKLA